MMDALAGAGGWGYFSGGLEAYARGFRFVEVNVSFYRRIPEATARRWRSRVPDDFVFALKANQAITHTDRLRASARARAAFSHDLRIARILRSPFLILETPPGLRFDAVQVAGLRELAGMSGDGLRLGLEPRAYRQRKLLEALRRTMGQDRVLDVRTRVHAARLIKNLPARSYTSLADVLSEIEIPVSQAARSSPERACPGPK